MPLPVLQPPESKVKGPDGTQWFSDAIKTVWPGAIPNLPAAKKIIVDCTVEAIEKVFADLRALPAATAKAKVDATYVVLVRPGDLIGAPTSPAAGGAEINAREILSGMGDPLDSFGLRTWAQNVLVFPEKGYGTVRVNGQIAFVGSRGISWAGIPTFDPNNPRRYNRGGYELRNVKDFGWGWCETATIRVNVNAGQLSRNIELVGFGWDGKITRDSDYGGIGVNKTGKLAGITLNGFVLPPVYHYITVPWTKKPSGAHSDSWQIQSGPDVTGVVYKNFCAFASTNTAFQNGGYQNLRFENGQVVGGGPDSGYARSLWPFEDNEATDGNLQALNGSGSLVAIGMDFSGGLHSAQFLAGTTRSQISYRWGGKTASLLTVNTTLLQRTLAQIYQVSPKFDAARQARIFGGSGSPVSGDKNPPSAVVLGEPAVNGTTVSLSWTLGTDDVAVAGYDVYRGGQIITDAPTPGTTFEDRNVTPGTTQTYQVFTVDTAGNRSTTSNSRTATIPPVSGGNRPPTCTIVTKFTKPVSGDVYIEVDATDDGGVTGVSLWSGPQELATMGRSINTPDRWSVLLDTEKYANRDGMPIEAHATDGTYRTVSATSYMTIDNRDDDPGVSLDKPDPKVSSVTSGAVVLSWPTVAFALTYVIDRRKDGDAQRKVLGTTPGLVFIDSGDLEAGAVYVYRVTARGDDSKTATSDEVTATTLRENEIMRLSTVTGHVTDAGLDPLVQKQLRLKFEMSGPATQDGRLIITDPKIVIPNADGSFAVDLVETTLLSPPSWYWVSASWLIAGQASAYERIPFKLRVPKNGGAIGELLISPAPVRGVKWDFGPPDPEADYPIYIDIAGERAELYASEK